MSKLHGEEDEDRMGRGELRNPGDRGDQPGQGTDRKPSVEDRERETRGGHELEPGVGPGESQQG
jgi:hypothetical protein